MIPRLAALSIAEISARTRSELGVCVERTVFCMDRKCVTTLRLRSDLFTVCRARLAADLVLAISNNQKRRGRARSRAHCDCQPRRSRDDWRTPKSNPSTYVVQGLTATTACPIRASLFVVGQQEPQPFAFVRPRAQRRKLEWESSGPGSEVLGLLLRRY
jgi:hypothetical protein